ncbi:ROK family protein, partial [Francisella tularensis subsp. holarctica]|nr:ROK family protein [Francisella tularensis subsp. holarctica]
EFFEKAMWDEIKTFAFSQSAKKIKIDWSETEGDFQVFSAAAVYLD